MNESRPSQVFKGDTECLQGHRTLTIAGKETAKNLAHHPAQRSPISSTAVIHTMSAANPKNMTTLDEGHELSQNETAVATAVAKVARWVPDLNLTVNLVGGLVSTSLKVYQVYLNIMQLRQLHRLAHGEYEIDILRSSDGINR